MSTNDTAPKPKKVRVKGKPGDALFGFAFAFAVLGVAAAIMGASSTDAYGNHTGSPAGGIGFILIALVLAAFGFGRRVLAALENKEPRA